MIRDHFYLFFFVRRGRVVGVTLHFSVCRLLV